MKTQNSNPGPRDAHPGGFLVMDAVWGIAIATVLLMAMTVAVVKQARAQRQLAETRAANRAAEAALLAIEAGQPLPAAIHIEKLPADAPPGHAWIKVRVDDHGAAGELVGLVKADSLEGGIR